MAQVSVLTIQLYKRAKSGQSGQKAGNSRAKRAIPQ